MIFSSTKYTSALIGALLLLSGTGSAHFHESSSDSGEYVAKEVGYGELYEIHVDSVEDNDWVPEGNSAFSSNRRRLPMGRDLVFRALGESRDFKIELFLELTEVWTRDAKISGAKAGTEDLDDRSYRGSGMIYECQKGTDECELYDNIKTASLTFFEMMGEHVFHAILRTDTEEFNVDPRQFIEKEKFTNGESFPEYGSALGNLEAEMYLFCSSDFYEVLTDREGQVTWTPKRRLLQQIDYWNNCYPGQDRENTIYRITMGMLVDDGFFAVAGNNPTTVKNYIAGMFNDINAVYVNQMSVEIALGELILGDTEGFTSETFNEAPTTPGRKTCPSNPSASSKLSQLRQWRERYHRNDGGIWHLMTNCFPAPGTVGIAYVGALCHSFGVGVNSWTGASRTWTTVAHEAGHNFGSGHTFDKTVNGQRASGGIMDYGDNKLNGVYQFHSIHKQEVCNEISASMTQRFRSVSACWETIDVDAPQVEPTAAPTRNPVTDSAGGDDRATTPPQSARSFYQWMETSDFGRCSATCGQGIHTAVVECRRYDLNSCPAGVSLSAADIATCSTSDKMHQCEFTVVSSDLCTTGCKPEANVKPCENLPSCESEAMCGNAQLDAGEMCDWTLDRCCGRDCNSWSTRSACKDKNPTVDGAVMDFSETLYLFQGNQMAKLNDWDVNTFAEGYPKPLSAINGLDAAFQNGVDSAASFSDDIVYLFKDMSFVIVDLGEMAQSGSVRDAVSFFRLNEEFKACGKIDAVVSAFWTMDFICGGMVSSFSWRERSRGQSTGRPEVVDEKYRTVNEAFPADYQSGDPSAAVRNPRTGEIRFYKGGMYSTLETDGSADSQDSADWPAFVDPSSTNGDDSTASCLVDNCDQCGSSPTKCRTCMQGFRRKSGGRRCVASATFVSMSFDEENTVTAKMAEMVYGEEHTSTDNGGHHNGIITHDGLFGNGAVFDGSTTLKLQDVDFGETVENWKISFWWKPMELKKQRFLTITNGREEDCGGVPDCNKFTVDFVSESETEPIPDGSESFAVELNMFGEFLDAYVDNAITLNEWNKICLEFDAGRITTTVNGIRMEVEAANEGMGHDNLGVRFTDWEIGAKEDGLTGTIDKLEVTNLKPDAKPKKSEPLWVKIAIGAAVGIVSLLAVVALAKCCAQCCKVRPQDTKVSQETEGVPQPMSV